MASRTKGVLSVGQCGPDHRAIRDLLQAEFEVEVEYSADIQGTLARLCQDEFDWEKVHGLQLTISDLRDQIQNLQIKDLATRKEIKGLPPDRADIILAGAMIILATMERLQKEAIHISSHGLRYGLFYQKFMSDE